MIRQDYFGIQKVRINGKMLATPLTEKANDAFSPSIANNSISTNTDGAFVFLHMPHLDDV